MVSSDTLALLLTGAAIALLVAIIVYMLTKVRGRFDVFQRTQEPLASRVQEMTIELADLWLRYSEVMVGAAENVAALESAGIEPPWRPSGRDLMATRPNKLSRTPEYKFINLMIQSFNREELDDLALALGLNPEAYNGQTVNRRATNLVKFMGRRQMLPELLIKVREIRPRVDWPDIAAPTTGETGHGSQ